VMACFVMADDLVEADYEATRLSLIKLEVDNLKERIKSASVLFEQVSSLILRINLKWTKFLNSCLRPLQTLREIS
jgi:hypothetical protein